MASLLKHVLLLYIAVSHAFIFGNSKKKIWVVDHSWHTGIILRYSKDLKKSLPILHKEFEHKKYLEFGWGDRDYYSDPNPSIFTGFKALFFPTDSLLHIAGFESSPEKIFDRKNVALIRVDPESHNKIISYIKDSFFLNKNDQPVLYKKGIYSHTSYFYKAKGTFYLFKTCNSWTAKAFLNSECKSSSIWDFWLFKAKDIQIRCSKNNN